jgi:hypothetical protein
MEISRLHIDDISAATKHWNQVPHPLNPRAPIFLGSDVTTFLHKYQSLAAFTNTNPTSSDPIMMFPYYCVEGSDVRDTVVMMHGYVQGDWCVLRTDISKMYFSYWKPPGMSERMWSVNLDASI